MFQEVDQLKLKKLKLLLKNKIQMIIENKVSQE